MTRRGAGMLHATRQRSTDQAALERASAIEYLAGFGAARLGGPPGRWRVPDSALTDAGARELRAMAALYDREES